jgi:hypothetical protein
MMVIRRSLWGQSPAGLSAARCLATHTALLVRYQLVMINYYQLVMIFLNIVPLIMEFTGHVTGHVTAGPRDRGREPTKNKNSVRRFLENAQKKPGGIVIIRGVRHGVSRGVVRRSQADRPVGSHP